MKYEVTVNRKMIQTTSIEVEANNRWEARERALKSAKKHDHNWRNIKPSNYKVTSEESE